MGYSLWPRIMDPIVNIFSSSRQLVVDFLDLTLLKDMIYVNIVLGISFALYSDVAFFTLQPLYLFYLGYSKVRRHMGSWLSLER